MQQKEYSLDEVAQHSSPGDCWIAVDGTVYDLSKFAKFHPGGESLLYGDGVAGNDATDTFHALHRSEVLKKYSRFAIGTLVERTKAVTKKREYSPVVPYGEALGYWRKHSPYYRESHSRFRSAIRSFIEEHVMPTAAKDDEKGIRPSAELNKKMGEAGMLAAICASILTPELLSSAGLTVLPGNVSLEDFDEFHELIVSEEWKRIGCYGLSDGLVGGFSIGFPPVLKFGTPHLVSKLAGPILSGDKRICLAITDPYAGSDVASTTCKGTLSACGKYYIVTGVKKWITGGMMAEYFTTAVRTNSSKSISGISLMVIERDDTVTTSPIPTSYSSAAGTAYVVFNETRVPVENMLGEEGKGFKCIMANFNKERWGMVSAGNRMSRLMVEECFKWAMSRKVFGRPLMSQPVIRYKLAEMAAEVESVHSFLEDVTYQMTKMSYEEQTRYLAGVIGLLKFRQTRAATVVADNACQIFGGRALTRTGMGQYVEKFQRSYKMQSILGGSEEILADMAVRQAVKYFDPRLAKM